MVLEQLSKLTENLPFIDKQEPEEHGIITKKPQHLAITMEGVLSFCSSHKQDYGECCKHSFHVLKEVIMFQARTGIPIMTVHVLPEKMDKTTETYPKFLDSMASFLTALSVDELIHKNKIKVTIFGKWYDMPGKIIDPIKTMLEETKDYDSFFLNFCINYDGQEEIVDSCKLIARQVAAGRLMPDAVTKGIIKENCCSSYFIPPDLIVKTGLKTKITGVLLWDSVNATIYFTRKHWPELKQSDMHKALKDFQSQV